METTVTQLSPVDYKLEITASAADLEPRLTKVLKQQRGQMSLKGFRKGKAPLSLVKKMHGRPLAFGMVQEYVQEQYQEAVAAKEEEYPVVGQPRMTEMEYDLDQDLRAVLLFGIKPQFEVADLSGETVTRFVHPVTDEDVEAEIDNQRDKQGKLEDADADAAITEDHVAVLAFQRLDVETGEPIEGEESDGIDVTLNDPNLRPELKEALLGKKAGEETEVTFEHGTPEDEGEEAAAPRAADRYHVTIQKVQTRVLPEVTDEWVSDFTQGEQETVEAFRTATKERLERRWEARSKETLETKLVKLLSEKNDFDVPETVVETYLDQQLEQLQERAGGQLPAGFDVKAWREENREQTEDTIRWMFVRDAIIEQNNIELKEEDFEAEFARVGRPERRRREDERTLQPVPRVGRKPRRSPDQRPCLCGRPRTGRGGREKPRRLRRGPDPGGRGGRSRGRRNRVMTLSL